MGREIRRVPGDWKHPTTGYGSKLRFVPLFGGSFAESAAEWDEGAAKWAEGLRKDWGSSFDGTGWQPREADDGDSFEEWTGARPREDEYMPDWPAEQRTHLMMYENTSEGTPLSPAFETPEELARWLADNNASAMGCQGATYEQWLATCRAGWAPSMVSGGGAGIRSGVAAMADLSPPKGKA